MREIRSIDVVRGAILAALGCGAMACGSGSSIADGADGGAGVDGGTKGCANPSPILQGGQDTGFETCNNGTIRRRASLKCPDAATTSTNNCGSTPANVACNADSDCKAQPHGYCTNAHHLAGYCGCLYGCVQDADCAAGTICACSPLVTNYIGTCVSATCVDSSSCGGGLACVATTTGGCAPSHYACASASDTCGGDGDCAAGERCILVGDHRVCQNSPCVQTPGRPFLVGTEERRAGVAARGDWIARGVAPEVGSLPAPVRARVGAYWTEAARMEHASIAAFARFTLELLALGAPSDLVMEAQRAMGDETEHATLCFALASAYRGEEVGPAKLSMDGVTATADVRTIGSGLIREGCIGETLAALEAMEAGARASDAAVREALALIGRDETRHAELSWRALAWIASTASREDRTFLEAELERAMGEISRGGAATADDDATLPLMSAHGLLGARERGVVREDALTWILRPAARACFENKSPRRHEQCGPADEQET